MKWTKLKWVGEELPAELNDGAIPYCQERDFKVFETWAKRNKITHYDCVEWEKEDIPLLLKIGKSIATKDYCVPNPGKNCGSIADDFDHGRIYKNDSTGEHWIVYHIYNNTYERIRNLSLWCWKNDLHLNFLYTSWYTPGEALGVVIYGGKRYGQ